MGRVSGNPKKWDMPQREGSSTSEHRTGDAWRLELIEDAMRRLAERDDTDVSLLARLDRLRDQARRSLKRRHAA
jgi:hypothetical protein